MTEIVSTHKNTELSYLFVKIGVIDMFTRKQRKYKIAKESERTESKNWTTILYHTLSETKKDKNKQGNKKKKTKKPCQCYISGYFITYLST